MLTLQGISYAHPNKHILFNNISFSVNRHEKIALIGNNGVGKSTLLKIIAKIQPPLKGEVSIDTQPYYLPQIHGQYDHLTVSQALRVEGKLNALSEILQGNATADNLSLLNDDWNLEERCKQALSFWDLPDLVLSKKMGTLSGGEKTRVFLSGIQIHKPDLILLDEPSNHLDNFSRKNLYDFVESTDQTMIVVSHDRSLLNLFSTVLELNAKGIRTYGGNFDFYSQQKAIENDALYEGIDNKERALRKAREKEEEVVKRQQKLDSRGKKKQEKAGVARIMMNSLRNRAENSTAKIKDVHAEKIDVIAEDLRTMRASLPDIDKMKFGFDNSHLHKNKVLVSAANINFAYSSKYLWNENLSFRIVNGERIALKGVNGSGKTTLLRLLLGHVAPSIGEIFRAEFKSVYIDQDYSMVNNNLTVYEQAQQSNASGLAEHEIKMRLNRFLFSKGSWEIGCNELSGGEKMRLMLCCLTIAGKSPDMIVLDEPTNNLDIQNVEVLTAALLDYHGTMIVVSHDEVFLKDLAIDRTLELTGAR
jgi:ATPase subunit of ABC transporter with duplicated ATPase domains